MARKLPWARLSVSTGTEADTGASESPGSRAGVAGPRQDDAFPRKSRPKPRAAEVAGHDRTPSTSPPPARPARAPPKEEYMVDGLDRDDGFRMVEDELLAMAQTFTAHLHAAEYQRVKAQMADAHERKTLARPVTGAPTDRVRKRNAASLLRARQNKALKTMHGGGDKSDDDDDERHAPWAGTSLEGLMEGSPQAKTAQRVSLASLSALSSRVLFKPSPTSSEKTPRKTQEPGRVLRLPSRSSPLKRVTVAPGVDKTDIEGGLDETDIGGGLDETDSEGDDLDGPLVPASTTHSHASPTTKRSVSFASKPNEIPPPEPDTSLKDDNDKNDDDDDDDDSSVADIDDLAEKMRRRREQAKAERERRLQQQRAARS